MWSAKAKGINKWKSYFYILFKICIICDHQYQILFTKCVNMASLWVLYLCIICEKQFFVSPEKLRKMSYAVMVLAGRYADSY